MRNLRQVDLTKVKMNEGYSIQPLIFPLSFPGGTVEKNLPANAGDTGGVASIPGLGGSRGVGSGDPLQFSYLKNSMDRGAWRTTVHGVAKSCT